MDKSRTRTSNAGSPVHETKTLEVPIPARRMGLSANRQQRGTVNNIIKGKRMTTKYNYNSQDFSNGAITQATLPSINMNSSIQEEVHNHLSQRTLKWELLACLYHHGKNFLDDYVYTTDPPTSVGSGYSGDVTLCRRRERVAVSQNMETSVRCVKVFSMQQMGPDRAEKLKNEAIIHLSLEHPHIARLFDVYDDENEVSLVMQYCSGGTLEEAQQARGKYSEEEFRDVAVQMLRAVSYIHEMGIAHRDIKPRNWVYEADGATIKLIDFGFSAKGFNTQGTDVQGCLGTLGYLAPEVVRAAMSKDASYNEKCDIWSLGVVFYELLSGEPAFHKEQGFCDGYTQEVVLRDIDDVTEKKIEELLEEVNEDARPFLRRMLVKDPAQRPSARDLLYDPYLSEARQLLFEPPTAMPVTVVLERLRAHSCSSKTTRSWVLAVARSPTHLPWKDFLVLRNTFKRFDARSLLGSVNLENFLSVVMKDHQANEDYGEELEAQVRDIWATLCGKGESLSYCEFLAVLLPPIDDAFEDVGPHSSRHRCSKGLSQAFGSDGSFKARSSGFDSPGLWQDLTEELPTYWDPSFPVSAFLPLLQDYQKERKVPVFAEDVPTWEIVKAMCRTHHRWVLVRYDNGQCAFLDLLDLNHKLVEMCHRPGDISNQVETSVAMARITALPAGMLANYSGQSRFVPMDVNTPLRKILHLMADTRSRIRRVPIINEKEEILHIFCCNDFLEIALQFTGPIEVMKSRAAKTFDHRSSIMEVSVQNDDKLLNALRVMDKERVPVCLVTSREFSGDMGGVVASSVVSLADIKWTINADDFSILDNSVHNFGTWRVSFIDSKVDLKLRQQRLRRFNVISFDAGESLHTLACRLLASKLQRIFLSSDELARIVGIVSARDILAEILDHVS